MASATNVIAGRQFRALVAAYNTAATILPADTVAYGAAITTPVAFTDVGYTDGGLGLSTNINRTDIRVDQEYYPVAQPIDTQEFTMNTSLAEMTALNVQRTTGLGTLTSLAAISGTRGHDNLAINSSRTETYNAWLFEVQQPDLEAFRMLMYRGIVTGSPSPQFTATDPATLDLEVTALVDTGYTGYAGVGRIALISDITPALP